MTSMLFDDTAYIRDGKYRMLYEIDQKNKIITIYRIKLRKTVHGKS